MKTGKSNSLSLNEFKRETIFHRQAQLAAIEGIARLKSQGIPTTRPDDYFAEMMKSDSHMQKVRRNTFSSIVETLESEISVFFLTLITHDYLFVGSTNAS